MFERIKIWFHKKDLEDRLSALEEKVFKKPDTIGFDTVGPDQLIADWDDSNEVYPMHWEDDNG